MTGWTEESPSEFIFNLSYFIKAGCVERAIVSAGGPQIECIFGGTASKKRAPGQPLSGAGIEVVPRSLNHGHAKPPHAWPPYTSDEMGKIADFYKKNYPTSAPHTGYVPMVWNTTNTGALP